MLKDGETVGHLGPLKATCIRTNPARMLAQADHQSPLADKRDPALLECIEALSS